MLHTFVCKPVLTLESHKSPAHDEVCVMTQHNILSCVLCGPSCVFRGKNAASLTLRNRVREGCKTLMWSSAIVRLTVTLNRTRTLHRYKVEQTHQTTVGHYEHHVNAREERVTPHLETVRQRRLTHR